jgi:hypothetical protein
MKQSRYSSPFGTGRSLAVAMVNARSDMGENARRHGACATYLQ